ncbi:MAG: M20 family metallopeptidase [Pirellulales bacterium]|nr:M20 family metallopeptidase [Pirellulales bacterium]
MMKAMEFDPVTLLSDLVSIPSVNPSGREENQPPFGEVRMTDYLEQFFQGLGLPTFRQRIAPGRENLIAQLPGSVPPERGGRLLLLDAHQDTVSGEGMTVDPWTPIVRDGKLFGRGSCDVKGGMAAMLAVLVRLTGERPRGMPTVVMACTADEEYRLSGAAALTALWATGSCPMFPRPPDAAVVAEPTGLDVITAHRGVLRWRCTTQGRAAHVSQPHSGGNAIYKMAGVLSAVQRYDREVIARLPAHPLCGPAALNVGTIHGGTCVNIVPERCEIEIEIRVPPGEDAEARRRELLDYLGREAALEPPARHDPPYMQAPPLSGEKNRDLAERLAGVVREATGRCRLLGAPYATDAAFYAQAGTPAVVFGPGRIEQAHTADEWISLDQFHQAIEILYQFIKTYCHD